MRAIATGAWLLIVVNGAAAEEFVEEIVVTGSYIARDNFLMPAPVDVITHQDILDLGTQSLGDILQSIPYNYGTGNVSNPTATIPQDANLNEPNLRGLGGTLSLMNGRRSVTDNAAWTYPRIAIERIEILRDGGSALYGSEAVAGVINYVPRTTFEGLEVAGYGLIDDGVDYHDLQLGALWGRAFSNTSLTIALEYRDVGRLKQIERPDYARASFADAPDGNPGTHLVPTRVAFDENDDTVIGADEVGFGPPALLLDPGCENPANTERDVTKPGAFRSGIDDSTGANPACRFEFREFLDFIPASSQTTGLATVRHTLSDNVSFFGEALVMYLDDTGRLSPSFPGGQTQTLLPVVGDHPGNPFRSFVDRNGNGLVDENLLDPGVNETLFALDANGNGIPDRDLDGDGQPDPGAEADPRATVLLGNDPFNPSSGIPFNEDVRLLRFRPVGKGPRGLPSVLVRGASRLEFDIWRYRATGGFDARVPGTGWNANLAITYDQSDMTVTRAYQRFSTIATGLEARVVDDTVIGHLGTSGDRFYNPFSTSQYTCTNRQCGTEETPSSSAAFNTQAVADQITFNNRTALRDELLVADLVISGDAFELPAGPAGVALGLHGRRLESKANFSAFQNDCDAWGEGCQPDTHDLNKYWAAFFEVSLPVLDDDQWGEIEAQLAGRYSAHTTSGADSFDPKIAVRYAPRPFIALRTSYSTAFVAPVDEPREEINLQRPFSDATCAISSACATRPTIGIQTIRDPASLEPEQSTSWNIGFSLTLLDDALVMEADYIDIDFDNRFTSPSANDILALDGQRFERFFEENIATSTPAEVRDAWIDPDNKATGNFESRDIVRDPSGLIRQIFTPRVFNAARMRFKALDLKLTARVDSLRLSGTSADLGILDLTIMATYVNEYSYQLLPTSEKMEGAGSRNWATGVVPPIPEWRGRAKLSWFRRPHSALLSANFTGKVIDDSPFANLPGQFPGVSTTIDALLTWDVQYTFSADQLMGSGVTTMTIGALNLFDKVSDPTLSFGGLETLLHDPRGRMFYARISHAF